LFKYLHTLSDAIVLYSKHELKYIKPKNRHKVSYANNTVNYNDYPIIRDSIEKIKSEFYIPYEKVVLFAGRMGIGGGRKKISHLIDIFERYTDENVGLVIVGSGLSEELQKKLNSLNTIYLGEVHDPEQIKISKLFKMADVFCIPGHVGLGLNQAMFWGLPVVTEEGGQPPEVHYLQNNRNGFIVPENDIAELENKIRYLLDNDTIRYEFSKNAKKDILMNASMEKMFKGFYEAVNNFK